MKVGAETMKATSIGYRSRGKTYFRLDPRLERGSNEHLEIVELCRSGELICGAEVCSNRSIEVVAEGRRQRAYFRHQVLDHDGGIRAGAGESEDHQESKLVILDQAREAGWAAESEVALRREDEASRPDLVLTPPDGGRPWAVEVQYSPLSAALQRQRTARLRRMGFRVCWVWGLRHLPTPGPDSVTRIDLTATRTGPPPGRFDNPWVTGRVDGEIRFAQTVSVEWELEERLIQGEAPRMPSALDVNWSWPVALSLEPDRGAPWVCSHIELFLERLRIALRFRQPLATAERRLWTAQGVVHKGATPPGVWAVRREDLDCHGFEAFLEAEIRRMSEEADQIAGKRDLVRPELQSDRLPLGVHGDPHALRADSPRRVSAVDRLTKARQLRKEVEAEGVSSGGLARLQYELRLAEAERKVAGCELLLAEIDGLDQVAREASTRFWAAQKRENAASEAVLYVSSSTHPGGSG